MKKYELFIGIDISKNWIDAAFTQDGIKKSMPHKQYPNTVKGYKALLAWLMKMYPLATTDGKLLFCMEHTGVYSIPLCSFLQDQGIDYVLESALRIKRSIGIQRGKNDKADSKAIARYAYLFQKELKISQLPSKSLMKLKHLLSFRARLLKRLNSLKATAKEMAKFVLNDTAIDFVVAETNEVVSMIKAKIKKVELLMDEIVAGDPELKRLFDLVTSVKGIGRINALQLIIHTNCFTAFSCWRKFACYIGIAPFQHQSGSSLKRPARVSKLGHKKLKTLVSSGVMAAIRHDKELKNYYERKLAEGKSKFKVINAVKNKLISRVFAVVKRGTPYVEILSYK